LKFLLDQPKVVWLQLGNCKTAAVEAALRKSADVLALFETDATLGTFVINVLA
jgi:predicted nuclease of predicted toxin-antitoxin system